MRTLVKFTSGRDDRFGNAGNRLAGWLEHLLQVDRVNALYDDAATYSHDYCSFLDRALNTLKVRCKCSADDLARIPTAGPVVVVSNHPFGAVEGMLLGQVLASIRPDVKVMANRLLGRITELRDFFILVDAFESATATASNSTPIRESLRFLKQGGMLGVFPAGEVSSLDLMQRTVTDPRWNPVIARLVRITKATVVPVYFDGCNSTAFQLLGLTHPRVRTAMLGREIFKVAGRTIEMRVGTPIPFRSVSQFDSDEELITYFRQRTYILRHRKKRENSKTSPEPKADAFAPVEAPSPAVIIPPDVIAPVNARLLAAEVDALLPEQTLVESGEMQVVYARSEQIPHTLREIGRLREITFRATGEGTGTPCDLDDFDPHYLHLFVWNKLKQEVVGGYRLGQTDYILAAHGKQGLYTTTLFDIKVRLLTTIFPALEMGRSFVRGEYQRSYAPLLLLWKGIGHFCVRHPRYRYLFGPVSISNEYQSISKQLMVEFLQTRHGGKDLNALVQPRNPFKRTRTHGLDNSITPCVLKDSDDVSTIVSEIEPDQKGLPVLIRQYLKLGAKMLAFNVDPSFGDCVDGLLMVDLAKTDSRTLERYMTKDGYRDFMSHHTSEIPSLAAN